MSSETFDARKSNTVTLAEWAAHHGLEPTVIPFAYRAYDPIEILLAIRETLAEKPPTCQTVRITDFEDALPVHRGTITKSYTLFELAGAWPYTYDSGDGRWTDVRWVNPHYVHAQTGTPSVTDRAARIKILERCADHGTFGLADLAPRFGVTPSAVRSFVELVDFDWRARRRVGWRRMARTCHVIQRWGHWGLGELAYALGVEHATLKARISEWVLGEGYDAPRDPSHETWFTGTDRNGTDSV